MMDLACVLFGIAAMIIGLLLAIPDIKDKLDGKKSGFGYIMKGIFAGIAFFVIGLVMILREIL
jgi:hypothetical protein